MVLENLSHVHDVRDYLKEIISLNQVDYERANLIFEEFNRNKYFNKHHTNKSQIYPNNIENNISVIRSFNLESNDMENCVNTNYIGICTIGSDLTNSNIENSSYPKSLENYPLNAHVRNISSLENDKKKIDYKNKGNNYKNINNNVNKSINLTNNTIGSNILYNKNNNLNRNDKILKNNLSKINNTTVKNKEQNYEKNSDKFSKNQLKILHIEKISLQRNQRETYSGINTSKNKKNIRKNLNKNNNKFNHNSSNKIKLNSNRFFQDNSKENSLLRNSFLNNSNITKNSQKSDIFKIRNYEKNYRCKESASKKSSFINSERSIEKERDISTKIKRFGFAATSGIIEKNKTSTNFFKSENQESGKNINNNTNCISNLKITETVKRPASVTNSNNNLFKSFNYLSVKNYLNCKDNMKSTKNLKLYNNSISKKKEQKGNYYTNATNSNINTDSNKNLINNQIRKNFKFSDSDEAGQDYFYKTDLGTVELINNNKVNSIRVNKDINNSRNITVEIDKNENKINFFENNKIISERETKEMNNLNIKNKSEKKFIDKEFLKFENKENFEKNHFDYFNYCLNRNTVKIDLANSDSNQNLHALLEEKSSGSNFGINEIININSNKNLNQNNNKINSNFNTDNNPNKGIICSKISNNNSNNNFNNPKIIQSATLHNYININQNITIKKVNNTPRHSFNALDLKKVVLQDPSFYKMNYYTKNIANGPFSVRNVSASQKINKNDVLVNNKNSINNNLLKGKNLFINTNNNFLTKKIENKLNNDSEINKNKAKSPNLINSSKNIVKKSSDFTIEKLDDFLKVANTTSTARNPKKVGMFVFDFNNKSNHYNSSTNSKDKYIAILNKKSIIL